MRRGLCNGTVSVRLSVRLSQLSTAAAFRAAGLQLWARRAGISIDSGGRTVPHSSTAHSSKCGQCHVVSWRMKLNTDWSRFLRRCRSMWWVDHVCRLGPVTRNTSCTLRLLNELVHTASTPPTLCLPIVHNQSYWFRFRIFNNRDKRFAFSALVLSAGRQEEHPACKNWVTRCWCGCLSGVRCKLSAYGPGDAKTV